MTSGREPRHISYAESALKDEAAKLYAETARHGDWHKMLFIAALRMGSRVGAGEMDHERAHRVLSAAGRHAMGMSATEAAKQVTRGLDKGLRSPRAASAWGTIKTREDGSLYWCRWWDSLDQADFVGTKGSTLLRLFAAMTLNGIAVGKRDLDFGVRQAALATGMSTNTLTKMLKKNGAAEASRYIRAITRAKHGERKTTTWRPVLRARNDELRDTRMRSTGGAKAPCVAHSRASGGPAELADADAFHGRLNAWRIYSLLSTDEEATVPQLVAVTGLTAATVRDNLRWLAERNLATRVDRFAWTSTTTDAALVEPVNTTIRQTGRRGQYERERDAIRARSLHEEVERLNRQDMGLVEVRDGFIIDPLTGEIFGEVTMDVAA